MAKVTCNSLPATGVASVGALGTPAGPPNGNTNLTNGGITGTMVPAVVMTGGSGLTLGVAAGGSASGAAEVPGTLSPGDGVYDSTIPGVPTTTSTAKL